jgi:hypothetical protein
VTHAILAPLETALDGTAALVTRVFRGEPLPPVDHLGRRVMWTSSAQRHGATLVT